MTWGIRIILLLALVSTASARADGPKPSCAPPIRLDRANGPLDGFPIGNQLQNGSCFAHVASLLLYAYERSQGVVRPPIVSPASISLAYAQRLSASGVPEREVKALNINSGGDLCNALNGYLEYGGCYASQLAETIGRDREPLRDLTDDLLAKYWSFRTYLYVADDLRSQRRQFDLAVGRAIYLLTGDAAALNPPAYVPPPSEYDFEAEVAAALKGHTPEYWKAMRAAPRAAENVAQCLADNGVETRQIPPAATIAPVLAQDNSIRFLRTVLEGNCHKAPDPVFQGVSCREVGVATHGVTSPYDLAELDRELEHDRPVALALSGDFLQTGTPDLKHNHAIAIIGRRANSAGECEYLIRNSWGKACRHYAARFRDGCEKGQIWLKRSELAGAYVMGELGQGR